MANLQAREFAECLSTPRPTFTDIINGLVTLENTIVPISAQDSDLATVYVIFADLKDTLTREPAGYLAPAPGKATPGYSLEQRTRAAAQPQGACAMDLAVRMLPPKERQRYRKELVSELADLPRRDRPPRVPAADPRLVTPQVGKWW